MSQKTVCDRCGHTKDHDVAPRILDAWFAMTLVREPVGASTRPDTTQDGDLCPWCHDKFLEFLGSYDPNEPEAVLKT